MHLLFYIKGIMIMKKRLSIRSRIVLAALALVALGTYMSVVRPDIEKPPVLAGFFGILAVTVYLCVSLFVRLIRGRNDHLLVVFITLSMLYLTALKTVNSLDLIDIVLVGVVGAIGWGLLKSHNKE